MGRRREKEIDIRRWVGMQQNRPERTRIRLKEIMALGCGEISEDTFGLRGVVEIYYEDVFRNTDNQWMDFMKQSEERIIAFRNGELKEEDKVVKKPKLNMDWITFGDDNEVVEENDWGGGYDIFDDD